MNDGPTIFGPWVWGTETVDSAQDLADRLGQSVWVPAEWPVDFDPEYLLMVSPSGGSERRDYQIRGFAGADLLYLLGHVRPSTTYNLEDDLQVVPGERFETLTRRPSQAAHVVVRVPRFDVHISGAIAPAVAMGLARGLVEVVPHR